MSLNQLIELKNLYVEDKMDDFVCEYNKIMKTNYKMKNACDDMFDKMISVVEKRLKTNKNKKVIEDESDHEEEKIAECLFQYETNINDYKYEQLFQDDDEPGKTPHYKFKNTSAKKHIEAMRKIKDETYYHEDIKIVREMQLIVNELQYKLSTLYTEDDE